MNNRKYKEQPKSKKKSARLDLTDRGLMWTKKKMIVKLNFWLKSKTAISLDNLLKTKQGNKDAFDSIKDYFIKQKISVYFVDVTLPEIKKAGFCVVKVIIPSLQPLFLNEEVKYLGGERIYKVPKILGYKGSPERESQLNKVPHPFL